MVEEIDAKVALARMAGENPPVLLDVREDQELAIVAIDGARHIPMGDVPARLGELDPEAAIICLCHHGMRSAQVAGFLAEQGFTKVANLSGGIDAWAVLVDESMPRY
jgi:rhodanese-related sulfurtransferase